jgi:phosphate/sulfate permease
VSEQKGRCGLPVQATGVAQCGQRGERAGFVPADFTHASYRRREGAVNRGTAIDIAGRCPLSAVRWGLDGRIVWAWILTIPLSALLAALTWLLLPHG